MRRTALRFSFLLAVTASMSLYGLVGMQPASAATITVNTTADEYGVGAGCALREAVQAANTDAAFGGCPAGTAGEDTIVLPAGTYALSIASTNEDANADGDLDVEDDVTIQGAGATTTTIDQTVSDRVIHVESAGFPDFTAAMTGVTVTGGDVTGDGGGIQNVDNVIQLVDVHVTGNTATGVGGGIKNDEDDAVLVMKQGAITANSTDSEGGGLHTEDDAVSKLTNVTVSGNASDGSGGGINLDDDDGATILQNVTVTGNTADADANGSGDGGGIDQDGAFEESPFTLRNTIVAGNTDASTDAEDKVPDCADIILSEGHNLIGNATGCAYVDAAGDQVGTGAAPINPMLGPLALNGGTTPNHLPLAGSPAINAGDPNGAPSIDQRGLPRDAKPDIGAVEVQAAGKCKGKAATLVGTTGNDVLTGTSGKDVVAALGGNDKVKTKGGKDLVCAGAGKDKVNGGGGKDTLLGQGGNDKLSGSKDDDNLKGGGGTDTCNGGSGTDKANCETETNVP